MLAPMSSLQMPLLDGLRRDHSSVFPALQKLLQLAYSEDYDEQLEAVMGISKLIEQRPVDASAFGPLCHTLSRLAASDQRAIVAYAARGIKLLVLDDGWRPQATVAGIPSVLAAALREWEDDTPCLREVLGAVQTLCCDSATILPVLNAGTLGPVLELLGTSDLELRMLSTAIAANVLSFSDTLLLTNEECIDAFSDSMEDLLAAAKSGEGPVRDYGMAALANACAHPVLAGRAKELGCLELLQRFLAQAGLTPSTPYLNWRKVTRVQRAETAVARLKGVGFGAGDVEEGGEAGPSPGSTKLQFYTFKWGFNRAVQLKSSPKARMWAIVGVLFWGAIVLFTLKPIFWG